MHIHSSMAEGQVWKHTNSDTKNSANGSRDHVELIAEGEHIKRRQSAALIQKQTSVFCMDVF